MARQRPGFGWPVSVLKRRGWTSELIRDLLPGPQVVHWERRTVRVWDKDAVRTAERDPRFAEGSVKKNRQSRPRCAARLFPAVPGLGRGGAGRFPGLAPGRALSQRPPLPDSRDIRKPGL